MDNYLEMSNCMRKHVFQNANMTCNDIVTNWLHYFNGSYFAGTVEFTDQFKKLLIPFSLRNLDQL